MKHATCALGIWNPFGRHESPTWTELAPAKTQLDPDSPHSGHDLVATDILPSRGCGALSTLEDSSTRHLHRNESPRLPQQSVNAAINDREIYIGFAIRSNPERYVSCYHLAKS